MYTTHTDKCIYATMCIQVYMYMYMYILSSHDYNYYTTYVLCIPVKSTNGLCSPELYHHNTMAIQVLSQLPFLEAANYARTSKAYYLKFTAGSLKRNGVVYCYGKSNSSGWETSHAWYSSIQWGKLQDLPPELPQTTTTEA